MLYLNQVTFSGDLASEIKTEVFKGQRGEITKHTAILAHQNTYRDKVTTQYVTVVAFGDSGHGLARSKKGDNIFVAGKLTGRKVINQSTGAENCYMEITASQVKILPEDLIEVKKVFAADLEPDNVPF